MDYNKIKKGDILNEISYYKVQSVAYDSLIVEDERGNVSKLSKNYVTEVLNSADQFSKEEKKTSTELAEILLSSPRIVLTVAFIKKDTAKTKTAYEKEVKEKIEEIKNANLTNVDNLLKDLIENPITKTVPGELRVMKGRYLGYDMDNLGRVPFIDMEVEGSKTTTVDARLRLVDTRTIEYIIVNDVKYTKKK